MTAQARPHRRTTNDRLDSIEQKLQSHDQRLESIDGKLESLDGKLQSVDERLTVSVTGLRREMRELSADDRRHFGVIAESLRDDIRLIAEGVATRNDKIDQVLAQLGKHDDRLENHDLRLVLLEEHAGFPPQSAARSKPRRPKRT
jgi:chromosome segregation ATPase